MKILVSKDEEQYGPYEFDELESYVAQGSFSLSDMCWSDGWTEWQPLSSIISRPPPSPMANSQPSVSSGSRPQAGRQEETVFADSNIRITTTRIIIQATTYALRNITSVKMGTTPAKQGCAIILLILGILILPLALGVIFTEAKTGIVFLLFSGVLVSGAVLSFRACKARYHVTIASASGEANALTSDDRAYIAYVVSKINEAIVRYQ